MLTYSAHHCVLPATASLQWLKISVPHLPPRHCNVSRSQYLTCMQVWAVTPAHSPFISRPASRAELHQHHHPHHLPHVLAKSAGAALLADPATPSTPPQHNICGDEQAPEAGASTPQVKHDRIPSCVCDQQSSINSLLCLG